MSTNSETAVGRGQRSSRHISSAQGGKNMFSTSYPALKPSRFRTSQILGKTCVVLMISHTLDKLARFTIELLGVPPFRPCTFECSSAPMSPWQGPRAIPIQKTLQSSSRTTNATFSDVSTSCAMLEEPVGPRPPPPQSTKRFDRENP